MKEMGAQFVISCMCMANHIWKHPNAKIFKDLQIIPQIFIQNISATASALHQLLAKEGMSQSIQLRTMEDLFKAYSKYSIYTIDGGFHADNQVTSRSAVPWKDDLTPIFAIAESGQGVNSLEAEFESLYSLINFLQTRKIQGNNLLLSDRQDLVNSMNANYVRINICFNT